MDIEKEYKGFSSLFDDAIENARDYLARVDSYGTDKSIIEGEIAGLFRSEGLGDHDEVVGGSIPALFFLSVISGNFSLMSASGFESASKEFDYGGKKFDVDVILAFGGYSLKISTSELFWGTEDGYSLESDVDIHVSGKDGVVTEIDDEQTQEVCRRILEYGIIRGDVYRPKSPFDAAGWEAFFAALGSDGSALHYAAEKDMVEFIKFMIDGGANLNVIDRDGNTPLMVAVANNSINCVRQMINSGADLSVKNNQNKDALSFSKELINKKIFTLLESSMLKGVSGARHEHDDSFLSL